jgi:hypothetical protein
MTVAAVAPNFTEVAPDNPLPKRLTRVPPLVPPRFGTTALTTGVAGAVKANLSPLLVVLVPAGVVTVISTVVPAVPGGLVTKS